MRNWLVQLLVDVGLVRPRDEVEGTAAAEPHKTAPQQPAGTPAKPTGPLDRRTP